MKKLLIICAVFFVFLLNCSMTRVLEQTNNSAVIQGIGLTKYEAKAEAMKKGKALFGNVIEKKEAETEEYRVQLHEIQKRSDTGSSAGPEGSELMSEIKKREKDAEKLRASLASAKDYTTRLERIIKKQDEKISELQKGIKKDILKKHGIVSPDNEGEIKF